MPKSSKKQINEDEKKPLKALQENSGDKIENIAKKCGFSRQKLWRIKKRLEENNTIWGYHAVVDQSKLDLKRYLIPLKRLPKPRDEKTLDAMVKGNLQGVAEIGVVIDSSFFVYSMYDWVLNVTANNIRQIKQFCGILEKTHSGHLSDIQVLEVLFPIEENGIYNQNLEGLNDFFLMEDEVSKWRKQLW